MTQENDKNSTDNNNVKDNDTVKNDEASTADDDEVFEEKDGSDGEEITEKTIDGLRKSLNLYKASTDSKIRKLDENINVISEVLFSFKEETDKKIKKIETDIIQIHEILKEFAKGTVIINETLKEIQKNTNTFNTDINSIKKEITDINGKIENIKDQSGEKFPDSEEEIEKYAELIECIVNHHLLFGPENYTDSCDYESSFNGDYWPGFGGPHYRRRRLESSALTVPVGVIQIFAYNTDVPENWLRCDGRALSREKYACLFEAIGTQFGAGDGEKTFNIPDLRGKFLRGWSEEEIDPDQEFGSSQANAINAVTTADENRPTNISLLFCIKATNKPPKAYKQCLKALKKSK